MIGISNDFPSHPLYSSDQDVAFMCLRLFILQKPLETWIEPSFLKALFEDRIELKKG